MIIYIKSIPSNDVVRNAVFDYMRAKNGNIVAVVDKKKESVINYIKQNQKGVVFAALSRNWRIGRCKFKKFVIAKQNELCGDGNGKYRNG